MSQHIDIAPLITAVVLDLFLISMTIAAINFHSAPLFMPNIVVKSFIDIFLILLGCSTIDIPGPTESPEVIKNDIMMKTSPYSKWQELLLTCPTLPIWLLLFILLLTAQIRILLGEWYRIVFLNNNDSLDNSENRKSPPSYENCVKIVESSSSLPSYDEALQKRNELNGSVSPPTTSVICINEEEQPKLLASTSNPNSSTSTLKPNLQVEKNVNNTDLKF